MEQWLEDGFDPLEDQHEAGGCKTHTNSDERCQYEEAAHLAFCENSDGRQLPNVVQGPGHDW